MIPDTISYNVIFGCSIIVGIILKSNIKFTKHHSYIYLEVEVVNIIIPRTRAVNCRIMWKNPFEKHEGLGKNHLKNLLQKNRLIEIDLM